MARSPRSKPQVFRLAGLGVQLAVWVALPAYLGYLVDDWLGTRPWFLITGCVLGSVGGLWDAVRQVERVFGDQEPDPPA